MKLAIGLARSIVIAIQRIDRLIEADHVELSGEVMLKLAIAKNALIANVQAYETASTVEQARIMGKTTDRDPEFNEKQAACIEAGRALQAKVYAFPALQTIKVTGLDLRKNRRLGAMLADLAPILDYDDGEKHKVPVPATVAESANEADTDAVPA